jgi:VanZ family protein
MIKMKFTIIISLLIIIAVLIPGANIPDPGIGGLDKFVHISMFAAWAIAIAHDFEPRTIQFLYVFIAGATFSLLTELLQILVEGRTFDLYDILADFAGLAIGMMVSKPVVTFIRKIIG